MIPFKNEPFVNFSVAENAQAMQDAWDKVNGELGRHYPLVIGGKKIETEQKITSINPSDKDQIVGTTGKANQELGKQPCRQL